MTLDEALEKAALALTSSLEDGLPMHMPRDSKTGEAQREAMDLLKRIRIEHVLGSVA